MASRRQIHSMKACQAVSPAMTLGRPLVSLGFAGSRLPTDWPERMGESSSSPDRDTKRQLGVTSDQRRTLMNYQEQPACLAECHLEDWLPKRRRDRW
jgi:hypothetical protein